MSWWDSLGDSSDSSSFWGDLFSSNSGGDSGVGGNWTDYFGSGGAGDGGWGDFLNTPDWTSDMGGSGTDGSGGGGWMNMVGKMFGGGGQGGSGGGIFGALLSGLGGAAGSWMDGKNSEKAMKMKGEQDRKTLAYTADLEDYFKQKDKVRKRVGLDTYGQFSQLKRWAPNYVDTPMPDQPAKPTPTGY
jgi:hypothetical protein